MINIGTASHSLPGEATGQKCGTTAKPLLPEIGKLYILTDKLKQAQLVYKLASKYYQYAVIGIYFFF